MLEYIESSKTIPVEINENGKNKVVSVDFKNKVKKDILGSNYSVHLLEIVELLEDMLDKQKRRNINK